MKAMFDPKIILVDDKMRGGKPTIAGTRFTVAQFLAEMIDGRTVKQIASDFNLPYDNCKAAMDHVATLLDRKWAENV